jgi:hypothetical protein
MPPEDGLASVLISDRCQNILIVSDDNSDAATLLCDQSIVLSSPAIHLASLGADRLGLKPECPSEFFPRLPVSPSAT